jgi:hypothetical protein
MPVAALMWGLGVDPGYSTGVVLAGGLLLGTWTDAWWDRVIARRKADGA